jgi:hypothetical protein
VGADGTRLYVNVNAYTTEEAAAEAGVPVGTHKTSVETVLRQYAGLDVKDWPEKKMPREVAKVLHALGWAKAGRRRRNPDSGAREYPWYLLPGLGEP